MPVSSVNSLGVAHMCNLRFRQVSQLFRQYVERRIAYAPSYDFVVYVYDYTSGQHPARRDRELPAAQVLGYAEEQGLQGGYQVTLHS